MTASHFVRDVDRRFSNPRTFGCAELTEDLEKV